MLDRTVAPAFQNAVDYQLPTYHHHRASNGPHWVVLPTVQQEVIKIELVFAAGKWHEPAKGIAHFATAMLEKGTAKKSAVDIASFFDWKGAQLEITSGYDYSSIALYALLRHWEEPLNYLVDIIHEASFPQEELTLLKSIFKDNLRVNREKNAYVAGQAFRKSLFGEHHPYGSIMEEDDVDRITSEDLLHFSRLLKTPAFVFVTAPATAKINTEAIASGRVKQEEQLNQIVVSGSAKTVRIEKEVSIQTALRLGHVTISRNHRNYPGLLLLNHLLGGYFGSRLMKNIREEKGLTYGIHSSITPLRQSAYWVIGAEVNKHNENVALAEIQKEILQIQNKTVLLSELDFARNHLLGSLQQDLSNPFSVMDKIKNIFLFDLSPDFYTHLYETIRQATPDEVTRTAQTQLSVTHLHTVAVG
ncbi:MAG: insulinase family protein [Cyclobacteriaceae bacterium]|nr:insulinase family protein [Cyclobacteriaceae bacterium]